MTSGKKDKNLCECMAFLASVISKNGIKKNRIQTCVSVVILAFLFSVILMNGIWKNRIKVRVRAIILAFIRSVILLNDILLNVVGPNCW